MKYGYARVSSAGQKLSTQVKQLQEVGCDTIDTIFKEKISGRKKIANSSTNLLRKYKKVNLLLLRS
ncbi:recombinase family protein [Bacillus sp. SYJ]|uniref:recombinase family protein n=1 Tax=Bacillus sp. SYJ TaxID=2529386 RepID=UPI001F0CE358|nr:recombinase family protein [Bacillus sp. SYJ]